MVMPTRADGGSLLRHGQLAPLEEAREHQLLVSRPRRWPAGRLGGQRPLA